MVALTPRELAIWHLRAAKRAAGRYNSEPEILHHAMAALDALERDARADEPTVERPVMHERR